MRFPNLMWALSQGRIPHYEAAVHAGINETRFSRCLSGRSKFSPEEQERLARFVGYPRLWVFQEVIPPSHPVNSTPPEFLGVTAASE